MKKTVWTFGLISGAILSATMLATIPFVVSIGFDYGMLVGYTTMVLAFLLVFFGVRSYRDNVAGGTVGFGRAAAVGSLIVIIAAACYVATWELIYFELAPDYAAKIEAHMIEQARSSGDSPAEIQAQVAGVRRNMELYRNPAINAAITFVEPLPVGLVFVLVSAGVLSRARRREEPELEAALA
jgi:Protein of unknown function (DUF4199)